MAVARQIVPALTITLHGFSAAEAAQSLSSEPPRGVTAASPDHVTAPNPSQQATLSLRRAAV